MQKNNIFSVKKIHTNSPDTEEVNESLDSIYREEGRDQVNISRLEKSHGRGPFYYINWALFLVILGIAGFFGYQYASDRFFAPEEGDLKITLDIPSSISSGEEFSFDILYTNELSVRAREAEVTIQVPDSFIIAGAVPQSSDDDSRLWKINSIEQGKTEHITITGTLFGEIGSNHIFQAFITYEPENFSSRFEEQTSAIVQVASGNIITKKKFPAQAVTGETLTYEIELFAVKEFDQEKIVRVTPMFPDTFVLSDDEANTQFTENTEYWEVSGLLTEEEAIANPQATPKIKFSGIFSSNKNREETITLEYSVEADDENFYLERRDEFVTNLIEGEFILSLILNGEAEETAVNIGDTLTFTLTYRNQSASEANNVELRLPFSLGLMEYETLTSEPVGIRDNDVLKWTKEEIPALGALPSEEGGQIDITVSLRDIFAEDAAASFFSQAEATIAGFGELETELIVKSNEVASRVNSDLNWYTSARYYNDDDIAIGTGPMPPQVGRKTTLHIIWRLSSSAHTINAINVTGKLPSIVEWTGKTNVSNGSLQYNDASRTITWQIDKLEKNGGNIEADFEISITPTFNDINTIILLMPSAKLQALDDDTTGQIDLSGKPLTSDLEDDPVLSGRGLVESE
jgi:hypothetical protein